MTKGCPLTALPHSLPTPPPQSASPGAVMVIIPMQPALWGSMEKPEGEKKPWLCLSKNMVAYFSVTFNRHSVIWTQEFRPTFEKHLSCQAPVCSSQVPSLSLVPNFSSLLTSKVPPSDALLSWFLLCGKHRRKGFVWLVVHHQGKPG